MIDTEELPPPSLAVKLSDEVTYTALCRLHEIGKSVKPSKWGDISLLSHQAAAAAAGYVAGVRHERKRQRQKHQITDEELALVQAYRITDDSERHFLLNFAKVTLEYAEKSARIKHLLEKIKKEPADAATRQQACTE